MAQPVASGGGDEHGESRGICRQLQTCLLQYLEQGGGDKTQDVTASPPNSQYLSTLLSPRRWKALVRLPRDGLKPQT